MRKTVALSCSIVTSILLASCGGGGSDSPPASVGNVTLSGRISFDRVPFKLNLGGGLDFNRIIDAPARNVVVEIIDSSNSTILATASTDASGNYSASVPGNRDVFVRAKAQMQMLGTGASFDFRILNNTNSNALYALDGTVFNTGTAAVTRNLRATSGWGGASYTATRSAAPFAILDTVYQAKELMLSANATLAMPQLSIYWSPSNRPNVGAFCPRTGDIVSTAYQRSSADACPASSVAPGGIYVQGDFANGGGDTDEFDQSVVAHEFGHYIEDMIGRSDSIGGPHGPNNRLDMRVAFSEGWGNAFSAMVLNDPIYRDSLSGASADTNVDLESGPDANAGWFSETSVHQILWDVFDAANESSDSVSLGFAPIFQNIVTTQRNTPGLTSLFSFIAGLKSGNPAQAGAIDQLLTAAPRNIIGSGDFASGETNSGGSSLVLPVYKSLTLNQLAGPICSSDQFGFYNRLANRQFLTFTLSGSLTVTINVTGSAGPVGSQAADDPDFRLWRQGVIALRGEEVSTGTPRREQGTVQLAAGTYVLEVYDYLYIGSASVITSTPRCMTVSVTG